MGWRRSRLSPWPFWSKLGLAPSNRHHANGTHNGEMRRLKIRNRGVANDPHDSKRKDKLITGRHISIDINKRENEVRREVCGNRVIVRQRMKNECHHHVKEPQTFCKARAWSVLMITP